MFLNPTSSCRQPKLSQILYCLRFHTHPCCWVVPPLQLWWWISEPFWLHNQEGSRDSWSQAQHIRSQHTGVSVSPNVSFHIYMQVLPNAFPKGTATESFQSSQEANRWSARIWYVIISVHKSMHIWKHVRASLEWVYRVSLFFLGFWEVVFSLNLVSN